MNDKHGYNESAFPLLSPLEVTFVTQLHDKMEETQERAINNIVDRLDRPFLIYNRSTNINRFFQHFLHFIVYPRNESHL